MERLERWMQHFIEEATRFGPDSATGKDYLQISEILENYGKIQKYVGEYDFDRLRELIEANREGRCVVLPAKIGDKVYHMTRCRDIADVPDGQLYDGEGGFGDVTGLYCPFELNENCPFPAGPNGEFDCKEHKNKIAVFEDMITGFNINGTLNFMEFEYTGAADFEEIGRYVFMSREAAEAALQKGAD